jgi:polyisoprenoid-binding protein YceI
MPQDHRPVGPRSLLGRRWTRWVIGAAAVVLVAVVGGPFVYIHFIEGKAPAPLTLSSGPTTTAAGSTDAPATAAPAASTPPTLGTAASGAAASGAASSGVASSGVAGTWNIASGSVVGYRIKETLFGQSNTAVGRTSAISGSITISATTVTAGHFTVDMTKVTSDQSQRDHQFQGRIMDTSTYPTATFVLSQSIQLGSVPADGTIVTKTALGNLTMHGTTKSVTFTVQARRSGSTISISGSIPIVFADYGISNPSGGPATTSNNGTLEFLLNLSHA